jgi:hypothetical protein
MKKEGVGAAASVVGIGMPMGLGPS